MGKRVASLLLSLVMMLSLLPTAAYATMADGAETQDAIVSGNGTGVSDDSEGSGVTGDQKVEGSNGSNTVGDTAGAEGGADPADSVNGNDSADPQDDGDAVLPAATNVARVGDTEYATLDEAIAALSSSSYTLELLDDTAWDVATPVYWAAGSESGYAATLADALTAAYKANGDITIVCRPGTDVGKLTHGHVADDITIYGNNAYISSGECELEVDTFMYSRDTGKQVTTGGAYLEKDITVTAYELDNLGVWGQRHTDHKVTVNLTDCDSVNGITVQRVYISGTTGVNDITLTGCDFGTRATSVYSNADGAVVIDNCSFTGAQVPVNFNHKANGAQTVTVRNSTFTGCGDNGDWKQFAAPVRFVNSGSGKMDTTVGTCTFTDTVGGNGDILLGDGRVDQSSNDVKLNVANTEATVQAQQPGYYGDGGTTDESKQGTKNVAASDTLTTSVTQLMPSSELTNYVTVSGIKGFDGTKFATFADAYAAIKPVVATLGLGQETPADAAAFDAVFTDISTDGKATLTYTITGNVTYDETGLDHLLTMGRSSSHYLTNERHLINFKFVGAEADRGATLTVNSNITLPYEWWGEKITTSISFENLTITGSAPSGLFAYQSFFEGIDFKVNNCTLKGIKIYNCANVGGSYTITNSKLDGTGAAKDAYAIHLQGNDTAPLNILIENNQISGYDRGVNIDQATAIATISGNSISINDNDRSCIQLTQLAKTTVSGNSMTLTGGNAITLHGNLAAGSKIEVIGNNITGTGYLIYDAAKGTIDLTYTDNTVSDTIDTTKGVYGGKEYKVSENVANALKSDTTTYVAEVKGVKYDSLQAAINAATEKATVILLADTRENVTINKNRLTLDLNGHTLNGGTVKGKPALTVTARNVIVKDSSAAKTGTIMREDTAEDSGLSSHYVIDIQGDNAFLKFEGGNVKNNSGNTQGKGASLVRVGDDSVSAWPQLTIAGGTFTQDNFIVIKVDRGTFYLTGGTLNSANSYAIEDWHRATIKGGTVNGTVAVWTYSGGHNSDLSIIGGTINGDVTSVNYGSAEGKVAKVSITGGTVNGALDTRSYDPSTNELTSIDDATKATIAVTGGTFSKDPTKYVVEDSAITPNADGTFGVAKAYLAKVGDTSYYTMEEAFKAQTASGEAIVLLRDYTTGSTFNSGSINRTVDLNGHTWTCTGTDANSAAFEINYPDATLTVKNGKVVSSQLVGLIPSAMGGTIKYDNSSLVFDGVEMTTTAHSGIETNGNNTNDTVTLKNSTLNVPNGFGIYFPSSGTLTIDNSVINAKTMGVQVCAGSLNISGAGTAITVSGDGIDKTINDGAIEDGAAISIVERIGYKGLAEIKVEGGKFTAKGDNAAVKAYKWENQTESDFTQAAKVSISGGTFSSAVDKSLCAEGFIPTKNADGTYGVKEGADGYVEDENGNVTISTAEGLFYFAKKANAGNNFAGKTVKLANDIDLNNEKWTPIGSFNDATTQFKGTFDGQNHAVTGLKVEESRKNGVGFFGKVYTGTIKNLTVEGSVSASGCNYVGGIVGHGYATITNCTFKGSVGSTDTMQVGGIAGSGGFTVTNCSVYADVTAECWAGGIVGNCQDGGAYTNCYVEGIISSKSTFWGGGAAGITPVPLYPSQVISGCYSNTVVKVAGEEVNCPIIACYNNPLDYNGYSGGLKIYDNSWNKQKNSNDSYPIYAEKDGKGGVLMEGMTAARDNSLIMLEDDLNYVTGDLSKVRIMAGSSVTQAQIDALAVASVGDSKYKPLAEAIDAAQDGQTVTLLADAAEDVVISKSITLDLGGKTLTNTNAGKATISVTSGTVTVKNGNVVGGNDYYNIEAKKDANLTLTDVTATAGNTGSSMIDNWGTLTITSGTYTGGLNVVKSEEDSKLTITGGTFELSYATNGYTGVIFAYGDTTISGGEFIQSLTTTGRWNHPTVVLTGVVEGHTAITRVTGGHFVNKMSGESIFRGVGKATSDNFKVSGGTFNKSIPDAYCADGFIPTKNADGTYGVKEGQYVAQINSKKYETLADAIRLATKGKTITLLADVEQNTQLTINKSITLDLNGKTIRNTVDIWGDKANAILSITNGAKVTITGNGTIDAKENDCCTINVVKGDLTIENGTFYGNVSVVQVEEGTLSVKGGTFDLHQKWEGSSKYLFNCIDKAYVDGSANVAISGGTFVGFDPNVSPEQKVDGKTPSFAAPGVGITRNENGSFTAVDGMTAQILDKDGNSVNAYNTLAEAVAAAQNGQTVRLLANVAESSIKVNANITIDLNKMTVTGSFVTYGEVTIQNGTIDVPDGETNYAYGKLTLADVDITGKAASSSLLSVNYNGSVTIDKDSTIVADSAKGDYPAVFIKGQDDSGKTYAPELNIYGTVQSAKTPAIQGNGTDRGVSHVNVFEGAVVKSESLAVYLPQPCEVNITGGLVEGYCGIGIKSGTLNISGGTVRGVANDNVIGDEYSQTNGISYDGSAIMIDSYIGYAGQVQINISGNAVVESKYSTAIREIGNDKSQTNLVGLDITGGTVLGAKDTDAVLVRDVTAKDVNISGGEFSSIVKKEYCAPGFTPVTTANSEGRYGVEIGKFTVMVTSRTTGSDSPVANVAGGGSDITYAEGITVTASAISGYNFVGWFVNEYTGTPYSTDLTCKVKPTDDWTMIAVYEPISGGKFWLTVTASEFTVNGGAVQDSYLYEQFAIGASVTVNFTGSENFLYWVNASNKVVSTEKSYTFIMGSETTLKAVYGKARQNQATVVFISHSDQIISSKAYTTNDTIQFPVPPIKMGCTFTGWSMTEADIRAAMANNSGIIQVRALYTEPSIACKVTVVYPEGTDNQVVNAVVGKAIDVTAKDIEGKTFSYWTDNAGNILGYTKTLKLAPSGDMTVKAVYDQAAEAKPVITMSEVSATTANESYVVTFMATRAVPNGYKVVKQGILWSRDAVCGEDGAAAYMQFDSNGKLPDGVRAYIGNNLDLNGVTRYDITTKYNDRTFYGRGYMVLESDAGELLYIYTDTIASGSYDSLTK
jgi:the GLUG motif protein family protein